MRTMIMLAASAVILNGCATMPARTGASADATIRYETTPCYGICPVYVVTIRPDGRGVFEGRKFTAAIGVRQFRATVDQYRRFAATLQPWRPVRGEELYGGDSRGCYPDTPERNGDIYVATDQASVDVRWRDSGGREQHLLLYLGCRRKEMREALRHAPDALPIAAFVKPDTPFPPSR